MSRSSWKIPHIILNLENSDKIINRTIIYQRVATITPRFIGQTVYVFNGLKLIPIKITEHHVGFKFGAFALTKKRAKIASLKKR
uniref:Ribosomal protein S19 n=2 Tax=Ulva TaxID=3118 RepID=A0A0U2RKA7_ULVPR|nr:ribosomal protein S19 [Ulva prolifera]YP_009239275.1 ribosomal protein S19 [Ulva linza]ALN38274.1 ribosomal protein S19 [Ulva prolifera]AML80561.1 ribosomal protein S19 [Ulva prolifera]AML80598.1 ribosomal protein S19 [Ulva linza]QZJ45967.1 ribosomal protein S19 [Ulva prolifera]